MAAVVRTWAGREVVSRRGDSRLRYDEQFPAQQRTLAADLGLRSLMLPDELGGGGWDDAARAPDIAALLLEVGRADAALAFSLALDLATAATWVAPEPREALAEALLSEEPSPVAVVLPGAGLAGRDAPLILGHAAGARLRGDGAELRLQGADLRPLGSGLDARLLAVACADDNGGAALALITGGDDRIRRGDRVLTTGLNAFQVGDLSFEGVPVPPALALWGEAPVRRLLLWLELLPAAAGLGAALGFWEILLDWVEPKVIKGGVPMKQNPLCAAVLSTVAEELAAAHLLLFDLAEIMAGDGGGPSDRAFAYGRLLGHRIRRGALTAVDRGLELMGSAGYAREWHAEKIWRDVKTINAWMSGAGAEVPAQMDAAGFFFGREREGDS